MSEENVQTTTPETQENTTEKKSGGMKEFVMPVVILVLICVVTTGLLAVTNSITAPVIAANSAAAGNATRFELLPDADNFTAVDTTLLVSSDSSASVTEFYAADNGAGYCVTLETASFGGTLTLIVGMDAEGTIVGISISDHSDTPGVGTKNFDDDYLAQYVGLSSLTSEAVKSETATLASGGTFTYNSGASVTGAALHKAVYLALQQYAALG